MRICLYVGKYNNNISVRRWAKRVGAFLKYLLVCAEEPFIVLSFTGNNAQETRSVTRGVQDMLIAGF
jgi:hypothetical protein